MKIKKIFFSILFLISLSVLAIHLSLKAGEDREFTLLISLIIILLPFVIPLLLSIFKRSLFHPSFWVCSIIMIGLIIYIKFYTPKFDNHFFLENYIAKEYFAKNAGFFTAYSPMVVFNQDVDSTQSSNKTIIKCIYRIGKRKIENYYLGKVEIEKGKVIKEYYNQKIIDDTSFAKKEFGRTLARVKDFKNVMNVIDEIQKK